MRFVCVFEAFYVCLCAGQSKTGSIVQAFETLLSQRGTYSLEPGSVPVVLAPGGPARSFPCWVEVLEPLRLPLARRRT